MIRLGALLIIEGAALAAMLRMRIDIPWHSWADVSRTSEELVAAGLLRYAAIGVVTWMLLSTALYALTAPLPRLRSHVGRFTLPLVRRVVDTALAVSLTFGSAAPALAAEPPPEPIVVVVGNDATLLPPGVSIPPPAEEVDLPTPPPPRPRPPDQTPEHRVASTAVRSPALSEALLFADVQARTYEVRSGDHLWAIAERTLQARTGNDLVPDHEIAPFWRRLIDINESTLRSGNPDLIYPGEVLEIPEA